MTERTSFLAELKRRNVIRVAIAYVAVSWLVLQAGALVFQAMDVPNRCCAACGGAGDRFHPGDGVLVGVRADAEGLKRESEIERDESITHLTGRRLDTS
jgi:hypothetical protein